MVEDAHLAGGGDAAPARPSPSSPVLGGSASAAVPAALSAAQSDATSPPRPGECLLVGAMSGTSADGVDAALVAVTGRGDAMSCRLLRHLHQPYHPPLRQEIFEIRQGGSVKLRMLARIAREISLAYIATVNQLLDQMPGAKRELQAIAVHGQTLFHEPPTTLQWIDPALVAAETGCRVISDFRRADCAAGGQGAPLVPFADHILFRDPTKTRVLLNIGGIANLTHLPAGGSLDQLAAFDTGPGNCISDHLMRLFDATGPGYDTGGAIACTGQPIYPLIQPMLGHAYFAAPPPKSTDGPAMIDLFAKAYAHLGRKFPFENLLKTACLLTATTIADAIRKLDPFPDELIVSGGGTRNQAIMSLLRQPLGDLPVLRSDDFGIPTEAKEAIAFALLGAATFDNEPSNVPAATGAKRKVVLGSVTPPP